MSESWKPNAEDRDALLSRVVDGEASATDWSRLRRLAGQDQGVWGDLAAWQYDRESLEEVMDAAGDRAELVEAVEPERGSRGRWGGAIAPLLGWGAAAALAASWAAAAFLPPLSTVGPQQTIVETALAEDGNEIDLDALLDEYIIEGTRQGRVIRELPEHSVISAVPTEDGEGLEVTYLRQILEKKVVDRIVQLQRDEHGNPVPVSQPTERLFQRASYVPQ
ncbi:MAG: hypothetical protein AAFR38_05290 [Planctomycetota bacterium]